MAIYDIAFGAKRSDKRTTNEQRDWTQIVERLRAVQRSVHTMEQYKVMTKKQRVDAKDCGFWIGGYANGRKCVHRQLVVLDIDEPEHDTLDKVRNWLNGCSYVIHSTHSSTPDEPKYRVVAPLKGHTHADDYCAMMHILHKQLELPVDVSTLDFNRIMFLPSIPCDADYFFETRTGNAVDVNKLLDSVPNYRDLSSTSVPTGTKVQHPKYKGGLVGAFCARYSITDVLREFLGDIWKQETNGRYTFRGSSTTHGGIIYEDTYLFSNHSTDPYRGRCHNAYDAVRLYMFGDGKEGDAKMIKECEALGVHPDGGATHALTIEAMEDEDAKAILSERLETDKKGNLIKSLKNARTILEYDPQLTGLFAHDLFSEMPVLKRTPPWREFDPAVITEHCRDIQNYVEMADVDESYLKLYFEENYDFDARPILNDALNIIQHRNAFHPIRDYLTGLKWDGVKRLEKIFIDCFGVQDSIYTREVGMKFFVAAVRRVFIPASKMDYIPVLVSEEGLHKSTFIKRMAKRWGSDTFYTFTGGKEAYEQLRGVWILEIPELNGVESKSTNARKAFITKGSDRYRSAYLKYTKTYDRQCVFIANSNDQVFLDDPSEEGRRWWGLMCDREHIKIDVMSDAFLDLVNDYWAEAVYYYLQGVIPMLSDEAENLARKVREVHKTEDLGTGALIDYINMPVPDNWEAKGLVDKRYYIQSQRDEWHGTPREYFCTTEIAMEFYGYDRKDITQHNRDVFNKVAQAIMNTGELIQKGKRMRFGEYGQARAWERKIKLNEKRKQKSFDQGSDPEDIF